MKTTLPDCTTRAHFPQTPEWPVFKRSYCILYLVQEPDGSVEVLRFWHSHREEPFTH